MHLGTNVTYEIEIGDGIVPTLILFHDEELDVPMLLFEPPEPTTAAAPVYELNCTFVMDNVTVDDAQMDDDNNSSLSSNGTFGNGTFGNETMMGNETSSSLNGTGGSVGGRWVCVNVTVNVASGVEGPTREPPRDLTDRLSVLHNGKFKR